MKNAIKAEMDLLDSFSNPNLSEEDSANAEAFYQDFIDEMEKHIDLSRIDTSAVKSSGNITKGDIAYTAGQKAYYNSEE